MAEIGGMQVALVVPQVCQILAARKRCEDECVMGSAAAGARAAIHYQEICHQVASILQPIEKTPKVDVLDTIVGNHAAEALCYFQSLLESLRAEMAEGLAKAKDAMDNSSFQLISAIEESTDLQGPTLLAMAKSAPAKVVRNSWTRCASIMGTFDGLVQQGMSKWQSESEAFEKIRAGFHEKEGDGWAAMHKVVASCLVVQVLFAKGESDEAHAASVVQNSSLVERVLGSGGCSLPSKLGLAWTAAKQAGGPKHT